jgi:hypothetical protein
MKVFAATKSRMTDHTCLKRMHPFPDWPGRFSGATSLSSSISFNFPLFIFSRRLIAGHSPLNPSSMSLDRRHFLGRSAPIVANSSFSGEFPKSRCDGLKPTEPRLPTSRFGECGNLCGLDRPLLSPQTSVFAWFLQCTRYSWYSGADTLPRTTISSQTCAHRHVPESLTMKTRENLGRLTSVRRFSVPRSLPSSTLSEQSD